jgi:tetratricopeptide (TPR) repeat protein
MDSAGVLGWGYLWYGKLTDAQAILGRVLNNLKAELGEDDPRTIDCLSDLAVSLSESDPGRSELLQREAYQRSLRVLGPSHADTINCIQHLGDILSDRGSFKESEKFCREAVVITRAVLGCDSLVTITAEHDLATLLNRKGVYSDEAEELYRMALSKSERNFGFDHSETLRSAHSYAIHLRDKGSLVEARSICERALHNAAEGLRKKCLEDSDCSRRNKGSAWHD